VLEFSEGIHAVSLRARPLILLEEMLMNSAVTNPGSYNEERWRFWRDVLVFNLKILLGNLRDFALIPVSLVAAVIDVISKGEREGSLFYRVLQWGAHSEEVLDAYSAVKHEKLSVNPIYTVDAVIARIEGVMVREYEKGGTAASIKAALDRVIDQVQDRTGGHREKAQGAIAKASEKLGRLGLPEHLRSENPKTVGISVVGEAVSFPRAADGGSYSDRITIRPMVEADAAAVTELAIELGYPNELENIQRRINTIAASDLLLVANDSAAKVVGFIQAHQICIIEAGFRVEILGLVVSSTVQRRGVGRQLIAEVENWAKSNGAETVVVRSNTKRTESHIFYPALGYKAIKTQAVYEKAP
jgi:predicted N-acetyltransferase YhbS